MSRHELGSGLWYDGSVSGYVMLDVTEYIPPLRPVTIDSVTLFPKSGEFHVLIADLRALAAGDADQEAAMVRFLEAQLRHSPRSVGVTIRLMSKSTPSNQGLISV